MSCLIPKQEGRVAFGGALAGHLVEWCLPFGPDGVGLEGHPYTAHPRGRRSGGLLELGADQPGLQSRQLNGLDDSVETLTEV